MLFDGHFTHKLLFYTIKQMRTLHYLGNIRSVPTTNKVKGK